MPLKRASVPHAVLAGNSLVKEVHWLACRLNR